MRLTHLALGLASSAILPAIARADFTITRTSVFNVDQLVPDGGQYVDRQLIDLGGGTITDVNVGIVLTGVAGDGAWAGDYYAALGHDTGYAVLLNRIGKSDTDDFGSNANGLNVTFDDSAAGGDVHLAAYDANSLVPSALTGSWAPDARETDPALVTTASPRTATLSSFNTRPTDGEWRLLVADDSYTAAARLSSWSLSITYTPDNGVLPALTATDILRITTGTLSIPTSQTIEARIVNQGLIIGPSGLNQALTLTGPITGAGDFQGNFILTGSYSPGNSPAAITFDGDAVFAPGHVLTMEIGGTAPGSGYDTLHVTGTLGLGGTLNVVFLNGFLPQPSDFFQFFTATSIGGNFAQVNVPTGYVAVGNLAAGAGFSLSAIPEPAAWPALAGLISLAFASRRKRRA